MSRGVGHRCGSDLALLWLWRKLAETAPNGPLAWEPSMCHWCGPEKTKEKEKEKKKKKKIVALDFSLREIFLIMMRKYQFLFYYGFTN